MNLIGAPVDDIVLAPPHTVPKTSSGKIRRVAARDYYERGPDAVRPQAVWLQFVRLAAAGVAPQVKRGWRVVRGVTFAARAYAAFVLTATPIFAMAMTQERAAHLEGGRRDDAPFHAPVRHPVPGARAREHSARAGGAGAEPHQLPRRAGADRDPRTAPVLVHRQARVPRTTG